MFKFKHLVFIFLLLFGTNPVHAQTAHDKELWIQTLEKLKQLDPVDAQATILYVRAYFDQDTYEGIESSKNNKESKQDEIRTKMIKTAIGYTQLYSLCKDIGWSELQEFYLAEAENLLAYAFGEVSSEEYSALSAKNYQLLSPIITPLEQDEAYLQALDRQQGFSSFLYKQMVRQIDWAYENNEPSSIQ